MWRVRAGADRAGLWDLCRLSRAVVLAFFVGPCLVGFWVVGWSLSLVCFGEGVVFCALGFVVGAALGCFGVPALFGGCCFVWVLGAVAALCALGWAAVGGVFFVRVLSLSRVCLVFGSRARVRFVVVLRRVVELVVFAGRSGVWLVVLVGLGVAVLVVYFGRFGGGADSGAGVALFVVDLSGFVLVVFVAALGVVRGLGGCSLSSLCCWFLGVQRRVFFLLALGLACCGWSVLGCCRGFGRRLLGVARFGIWLLAALLGLLGLAVRCGCVAVWSAAGLGGCSFVLSLAQCCYVPRSLAFSVLCCWGGVFFLVWFRVFGASSGVLSAGFRGVSAVRVAVGLSGIRFGAVLSCTALVMSLMVRLVFSSSARVLGRLGLVGGGVLLMAAAVFLCCCVWWGLFRSPWVLVFGVVSACSSVCCSGFWGWVWDAAFFRCRCSCPGCWSVSSSGRGRCSRGGPCPARCRWGCCCAWRAGLFGSAWSFSVRWFVVRWAPSRADGWAVVRVLRGLPRLLFLTLRSGLPGAFEAGALFVGAGFMSASRAVLGCFCFGGGGVVLARAAGCLSPFLLFDLGLAWFVLMLWCLSRCCLSAFSGVVLVCPFALSFFLRGSPGLVVAVARLAVFWPRRVGGSRRVLGSVVFHCSAVALLRS